LGGSGFATFQTPIRLGFERAQKYMRRVFCFGLFLVFLPCFSVVQAKPFNSFVWISRNDFPQIYDDVKGSFATELQPDDPKKVRPIVPYFYKYIARIGIFRTSCLVLIGYREKEGDPKEYDHFRAFSYDLISHAINAIMPKEGFFYKFSTIVLAVFEPSPTPDIVFKYLNCMECESVELLSSFRYDPKSKRWDIRIWPDDDPHLMIGSDPQYGDDIYVYDCLYDIRDFNNDGFTDIAIRCRETNETSGKGKETILVYTIQKGAPQKIEVRDKRIAIKIRKALCENNKSSPLCEKQGK